jgi:hypothetical protein
LVFIAQVIKMRITGIFLLKEKTTHFLLLLWIFVVIILSPNPGFAKTIFYGVGNDGYFTDVVGIESALFGSIGASTFSSYTYSNLTGSDIYNSTVALKPILTPNDTLVWYYSGHGHFFQDDAYGDETQSGSFALDRYDEAVGLQGNSDWLSDDELAGAFYSLADTTARILTIVDMCYAGGLVGGTDDLNTVSGLTFLGSSSELQASYYFLNDSYSLFTDSLISGLSSWTADSDNDGILMASEWYQYAYDTTVSSMESQHPVFYGKDMIIASQTTTPVPLPGAFILLGSGLFAILIRRRIENKRL